VWRHEIDDLTPEGRLRLVARLAAALAAERRRGRRRHWTYDVARHRGLIIAYRSEVAALLAETDDAGRP